MLVQIASVSGFVLAVVPVHAADEGYLVTAQPQIAAFVRKLPLPEEQLQATAKMVAGLQASVAAPNGMAMPAPGSGMVWMGGSDLHVLHQIGHLVLFGLLPERMRPLQWHPSTCAEIGASRPLLSENIRSASEPFDSFAEAAAYFFVLAYGSYQHTQGQPVDPAAASLWALGDTPAGLDACAKTPALKQLRALSSLYGPLLVSDPARAYADFYTAYERQSRRSAGWPMPARTLTEWLFSRQLYGGLSGVTLAAAPTDVMAEFSEDNKARLVTCGGQKNLDVSVNGQALSGVKVVDIVQSTRMQTGDSLAILQLGTATRLLLGPHTECETILSDDVALNTGEAYVEGPATVRTPICTVLTGGSSVAVRVTRVGETMLGVLAGTATLGLRGGREILVNAGEVVTVMGDGQLLGPGRADPLQIASSLPLREAPIVSGPPTPSEVLVTAAPKLPTATPHAPETDSSEAALLASTDEWQIHMPKMLRQAVLCQGLDGSNHPAGVSAMFPSTTKSVSLYIDMDLGGSERQLKIRWRRGEKSLSGRIVRASGKRQILNALTPKSGSSFRSGEYQVDIEIDDKPAATLKFLIVD